MPGAVLIVLAMVLVGPIALFVAGAIFSAGIGWLNAPDTPAEEAEAATT